MSSLQPFNPASKNDIAGYAVEIGIEIDHPGVSVLIQYLHDYGGKVSVGRTYGFDDLQYYVNEATRNRGSVILTLWLFNANQVMEVLMATQARLTTFDVLF
ncbi:hypothetical protein [Terasakiella pusilla]|jgi:hypothetical protein|uniref:hypothetical protein n=1 Tax=Terasakiella pusilla TaxID=64973 RepID=UPI00048AA50D|nr:hypothetical protein [Terasakiella pusilla]